MQGTNKIIFNSIILYTKIIVCMVISLWTVPLVLQSLGTEDFGLYNLVAGVIVMLAFLNGAMTVSTQRYISVTIGENNNHRILEIYNLSLLLNVLIGIVLILIVELSIPLLFEYVLNVPTIRQQTAIYLFHYLVISMFFTIVAVPFDAVLNAYENMIAFSVIGIIESLLRLSIAFLLPYIFMDKLDFYGMAIMIVTALTFLLKYLYTRHKYKHLCISHKYIRNQALFIELSSFAGWNALASIAIVARNQGVAMVLNHFFGTIINAAYGIANQVNGVLGYFSQTIQKSVNPQLMENRGRRDAHKVEVMTYGLTRFTTLCMGVMAIPLFIELPYILKLWLGVIPEYTISFTRLTVILSLLFQLSSGLMSAIQSTGKIKWYAVCVCMMMLSIIIISYAFLVDGYDANIALVIACLVEIATMAVRLLFAKKLLNLSVLDYLRSVIIPLVFVHFLTFVVAYLFTNFIDESFLRVCFTTLISFIVFLPLSYAFVLSVDEKNTIQNVLRKVKR